MKVNELNAQILECEKRMQDLSTLVESERLKVSKNQDDMTLEEIKSKNAMIEEFEQEFTQKFAEKKSLEMQVEQLREEVKNLNGLNSTNSMMVVNNNEKSNGDKIEALCKSQELLNAWSKAVHGNPSEYNQMVKGLDTTVAAGVIPTYVSESIERKVAEIGGLFNHAQHLSVKGIMQMAVEVSSTGAEIHTEGGAMIDEEEITLESLVVQPTMVKKWISYTDELEALSGVDLVDYLVDEFIEKHILKIEQEMLNGADDAKGLVGIYTLAGTEYVAEIEGDGTAITYANILSMLAATKGANLKWFMTRNTFYTQIMGLVDSQDRPIFNVVGTNGTLVHTLLGYPVEFEEVMTDGDMILMNQNAYKTNTPNGVTPVFTLDRLTGSREDKVYLTGKTFIGGRVAKLEQTSVFTLAPAGAE